MYQRSGFCRTCRVRTTMMMRNAEDDHYKLFNYRELFDTGGIRRLLLRLNENILVEICKYLTLDHAVIALPMSILPLLRQAGITVYIFHPSNRFLTRILQYLDARQVTSVCLSVAVVTAQYASTAFHTFDDLTSLPLLNPGGLRDLGVFLLNFSTVRTVSL